MTLETPARQSLRDCELRVDIARQAVDLILDGSLEASWPVSTSRYGIGFEPGSFKTPTGRFVVAEKIGAGVPLWAEFKSRQPTGAIG
jgi:hypothetical protein